jgi:Flp pilus assembly protein TadD
VSVPEGEHFDALYSLGILRLQSGAALEAVGLLRRALACREDPGALTDLAIALAQTGRPHDAEAAVRRALELRDSSPEAHNTLGLLLCAQARAVEAESAFRRALELREAYPQAHNNLGVLFAGQARTVEAERAYRRALELREGYPEAHNNLGVLLAGQARTVEAERDYRRALELREAYPEAHDNLGILLAAQGRTAEAEREYGRALELNPDHHGARWNLALLQLSLGRYREGWRNYETRCEPAWRSAPQRQESFPLPRWRGEDLAGKSLLLLCEQGLGDCVQFVRYAPLIKQRLTPARLAVRCPAVLGSLFAAIPGVDAVEVQEEPVGVEAYDRCCLLGSLPLLLGTTSVAAIPAALPYLRPPAARIEHWRRRLPREGLRVGLVWKAGGTEQSDQRSLRALAALAPLWQVQGASFVSLQKGRGEDEAAAGIPGHPLAHVGSELGDFADTAAALSQLDLLITVDTAFAHLSGALGRPTWILLPAHGADWRWLRDREDSPWYPGVVRLFRQPVPGEWQSVIARIAAALSAEIRARCPDDQGLARTGDDRSHAVQDE